MNNNKMLIEKKKKTSLSRKGIIGFDKILSGKEKKYKSREREPPEKGDYTKKKKE